MAQILLVKINIPTNLKEEITVPPPIGLWCLRTAWEVAGADVDICDEQLGDNIEDFFAENHYDIVALSAAFSIGHFQYLEAAEKARQHGAYVLAGNQHASAVDKPNDVDEVWKGPGEFYFSKNVPYAKPFFSEAEAQRYWDLDKPFGSKSKTKRWMPFETSRGCTGRCGFCASPRFWGKWHSFPLEKIRKHFVYLKHMGIEELFTIEDYLTIDKERFITLLKMIKDFGFSLVIANGTKTKDLFDKEIFDALINSTCWQISLPLETGSKKVADLMRLEDKWIEFDKALDLVTRLKEHGIQVNGGVMIGYPGENLDDMRKSLEYINGLPLDERGVAVATPYPGTHIYKVCRKNNWLVKDIPELYKDIQYLKPIIHTPDFTPEQVGEMKRIDREAAMKRKGLL